MAVAGARPPHESPMRFARKKGAPKEAADRARRQIEAQREEKANSSSSSPRATCARAPTEPERPWLCLAALSSHATVALSLP